MAEHDDINVFVHKLRPKDVRQQNPQVANVHARDLVTVGVVVVAADERDRRDLAQRVDDMIAADVAGVKDRIDTCQRLQRFRTDQTVRVGDDANARLRGLAVARSRGAALRDRETPRLLNPRCSLSWPRWNSGTDP